MTIHHDAQLGKVPTEFKTSERTGEGLTESELSRPGIFSYSLWCLPPVLWSVILFLLGVPLTSQVIFYGLVTVLFFLPGFALLRLASGRWRFDLWWYAPVLGMGFTVTVYALARWLHIATIWWLPVSALTLFALLGIVRANATKPVPHSSGLSNHRLTVYLAAWLTVFLVAGTFSFSGRMEEEGLTYYGFLGRDPILHLAMIVQLQQEVPSNNFIVSGFPLLPYHFFPDLSQALLRQVSGNRLDLNDLYFRLYPSFLFFFLGGCGARLCFTLFHTPRLVCLALVLLIGGADFSFFLGALQTLRHFGDLSAFLERAFAPWSAWNLSGGVIPLVHRPAYYHGMMFLVVGFGLLVDRSLRRWPTVILAGMVFGTLAGFNFTLGATVGVALVVSALALQFYRSPQALEMIGVAGVTLIASLPVLLMSLSQRSTTSQLPLHFDPGNIARFKHGTLFADHLPVGIAEIVGFSALGILIYGLRLPGFVALWRNRGRLGPTLKLGILGASLLGLNLMLVFLFEFEVAAGEDITYILLQPTPWLLGLFAIAPLGAWMDRGPFRKIKSFLIWTLVVLPPLQALLAVSLHSRTVIQPAEVQALELVERSAESTDVIVFRPGSRISERVLGNSTETHNFHVPALSGLRGYLSSEVYSQLFLIRAGAPAGEYERRLTLVNALATGTAKEAQLQRLFEDGVRWVLLPSDPQLLSPWVSYVYQHGGITLLALEEPPVTTDEEF